MSGHGSTAILMTYGDANTIALDIGEYKVLPAVKEIPVICGVNASDPRRRIWDHLLKVKDMGFSGINNFPTHTIIDGQFRLALEETAMGVLHEVDRVILAQKHGIDLFSIVYVATPKEAKQMAGADVMIAHMGCTIGVTQASYTLDEAARGTQMIIDATRRVLQEIIFLGLPFFKWVIFSEMGKRG